MATMTPRSSLPEDLPPLDVTPGPVRAQPLPADRPVRWGILATGKIATAMVRNLALLDECAVVAVGARRQESADAFAAEHRIGRAYGDYHALHREHVELAFEAGKAVLCEKALTLDAPEAEHLVALAREKELFLMEAMWMRCNPLVRRLQQLMASGALGEVRQVRADLGFVVDKPATDRLLDPALGGGALLDMGVYPLTFAGLFLGEPSTITAVASLSGMGVDLNLAIGLGYDSGAIASLTSTMTAWSPRTASIATDRGRIDFPPAFHHPTRVTWTPMVGDPDFDGPLGPEVITGELIGTGLANEALEVARCLRSGETESPLVPLDDSLALMRQMDTIRSQIGVRYAADA